MTVNDYIHTVKANRYTYYNLGKESIKDYKKLYTYLKKHKDKAISSGLIDIQIKTINNEFDTDYLIKYKTMQLISYNIIDY
tara:strand:+ start:237 stop:479 length:243 start_codon:yes stop_codon:yes gene_type:complete